jgi:pyridoxamine 5'-phosphate oxidase family protein
VHTANEEATTMATTATTSERITEEVTSWPGVEAGPGRRGEYAFKVGRREIGHLHGDHAAHFFFPQQTWAELRKQGRIADHPVFPGKQGPAARRIESEADVEDVIALMRLNYEAAAGRGAGSASEFSAAELAYLAGERRLGRIATVGRDGTPHVVPVGLSHNEAEDSIDVRGRELAATKKFGDVERNGRAAIVIDDLASVDPWRPRGIEVRGRAEAIREPEALIRIHPERIVSWGIESERRARTVG